MAVVVPFDELLINYVNDFNNHMDAMEWIQNDLIMVLNHGQCLMDGRHHATTDDEWTVLVWLLHAECNEAVLENLWSVIVRTRPDWIRYMCGGLYDA